MRHPAWLLFSVIGAMFNFYLAYRRANDSSERTQQKAGMTSLFQGDK